MNRRTFLGSLVGGSLALIAGCSSPGESTEDTQSLDDVEWPETTSNRLRRWNETGTKTLSFKTEVYGADIVGHTRTRIYESTALRTDARKKTLGQFDNTLASFFATNIDLRGHWTAAVSATEIGKRLQPEIHKEFKNQGIQQIREITPSKPTPDVGGSHSMLYEFEGQYSVPTIARAVEIPDVGRRTLKIEGGTIPVAGLLAVWKQDHGTALAGGGAYPKENYFESDTISITGSEDDGINITVSVDLGLQPAQIRREIIDLVESTRVST